MSGEPPPRDGATAAGSAAGSGSGLDLAKAVLARARAEARRRGVDRAAGGQYAERGQRSSDADRRADASRRSGAGPDERDPQPLRRTIDRLLAERGWETPAAVHGVVARWEQVVGSDLAAHCRPERFADGDLHVIAESTAWATQVRLLAGQLVRRLNEELGDGTVRRVVVRGPSAPSWRRGPLRAPGGRGPRDTYG